MTDHPRIVWMMEDAQGHILRPPYTDDRRATMFAEVPSPETQARFARLCGADHLQAYTIQRTDDRIEMGDKT